MNHKRQRRRKYMPRRPDNDLMLRFLKNERRIQLLESYFSPLSTTKELSNVKEDTVICNLIASVSDCNDVC